MYIYTAVIASYFVPRRILAPDLDAELSIYLSLYLFLYLSIYLLYICCVCRKHIFGHVLRIDASLDYIVDLVDHLSHFLWFLSHLVYYTHACHRAFTFSVSSAPFQLRRFISHRRLAFFKIYFGLVFAVRCSAESRLDKVVVWPQID